MNLHKDSVLKIKRLEEWIPGVPPPTENEKLIVSGTVQKFLVPMMQLGGEALWAEYDRAEDLLVQCMKLFEGRFPWAETLIGMVKSQRGTSEAIPIEEAIRKFGIHNTRVYLIACHLAELLPSKELAKDPGSGRFMNRVSQSLKYMNQAGQAFPDDTRYFGTALCAGLLYDFLYLAELTFPERTNAKKFNDLLTAGMTESLNQANIAINFARGRTRMVLEKYIPSTLILAHAGRAVMGLFQPAYFDFLKKVDKFKIPPSIQQVLERQIFGVDHLMIASLLCNGFEPIKTISRSLMHLYRPFELDSKADVDHYDLSCIALLGVYSASNAARVSASDGKPAKDLRPEFRKFDLTIKASALKKKETA